MKKTIYRVSLLPNANSLCDTIALLACRFNGGQNKYTLENFKTICEAEKMLYPCLSGECTIELLDENTLHIDMKVGEEYKTVLIIERVEITELATDILDELAPSLNRHGLK